MVQAMAKFQKGHKFAKGGARPGSGRKPSWFKELCQDKMRKHKLIEIAVNIAIGKPEDEFITDQGECIPHRAKANVRLEAIKFITEHGVGKPNQAIEHSGNTGGVNIFQLIREAEAERNLPSSFEEGRDE